MSKRSLWLSIFGMALILVNACTSNDGNFIEEVQQDSGDEDLDNDEDDTETDDNQDTTDDENVDSNSIAPNGCQNVVIANDFAYAACGEGIEVVSLETLERNFLDFSADDITADTDLNLLFTQSGSDLRMLDLGNPMQPQEIELINTNFGIFSGISAANGILVVSAGTGGSDTQVYTYTSSSLSLVNDGIPLVDGVTGNPDVHVTESPSGAIAFYSQDLGAVANWGIQVVEFDFNGAVVNTPPVVVLTPRQFTGGFGIPFGPANFPTESEFLDNQLYVAHFGAPGIHIVDLQDSNALSLLSLSYEPTNIGTDGTNLFVVGVTQTSVDIIDPVDNTIIDQIAAPLEQPIGIAASESHIIVADRSVGLIVINR